MLSSKAHVLGRPAVKDAQWSLKSPVALSWRAANAWPASLRIALLVLAAVLALPLAQAGSATEPEVTDARGDATVSMVPAPAGFGWADIQAAWFESDGEDITLSIKVDGGEPVHGEVGVTFTAGAKHYIAGYTVVPGYAGGFLSEADAQGDVPETATPQVASATWTSDLIRVTFTREAIGNPVSLASPWAWSESTASNGEEYRIDVTEPGRAFALHEPVPQAETSPSTPSGPEQEASAIPLLGLLVALGVAARMRR